MPNSCDPVDCSQPSRLPCPWDFPGKNTGVGCHFLLQGIFPTQGSNPGFPHSRQILYQLSHKGSLCSHYPNIHIQYIYTYTVKSLSRARLFVTPWTVACTKLLCPWGFLGKSTGVGCRFLLQGIFPTQRSNPGLPHCRQTLYRLSHQGRLPEEPGRLQSMGWLRVGHH